MAQFRGCQRRVPSSPHALWQLGVAALENVETPAPAAVATVRGWLSTLALVRPADWRRSGNDGNTSKPYQSLCLVYILGLIAVSVQQLRLGYGDEEEKSMSSAGEAGALGRVWQAAGPRSTPHLSGCRVGPDCSPSGASPHSFRSVFAPLSTTHSLTPSLLVPSVTTSSLSKVLVSKA